MRNKIFISHASPEDNDFARWISLKLIGLGYDVWCDVIDLKGGDDWWPIIENEIRNNTIKYLPILSLKSNSRDGVLKELAVAQKVKKQLNDFHFIIPLHIDSDLSYDDVNIELNRLNSLNFKKSWASGLNSLLELFEELEIPKSSSNFNAVKNKWEKTVLNQKPLLEQEEDYFSNWFPIIELPLVLRFHKFKYMIPNNFDLSKLNYPALKYKDYLATFAWCYDFITEFPRTEEYRNSNSVEIPLNEILKGEYHNNFIKAKELKNIVISLLNKSFDKTISNKTVAVYQMSNKISFWIKKSTLEKGKYNKVQLIGKQKERNWHFGISGNVKLFPELCFVINSHIWFTSNGEDIIDESSIQHSARRRQGRNWWNNDWRNKLLAFVNYISENDNTVKLYLGSEEYARINSQPIMFRSPISYLDPNIENLPDEQILNEDLPEDNMIQIINDEIE